MDTMDKVVSLNDPGCKKEELAYLEGVMTKYHRLMNDAMFEGCHHAARFYDGIRYSAFVEWMKLREE